MNAKMPELKRAFEKAGFANVVTVLSSGNVVFDADRSTVRSLEQRAERAMEKHLDRTFLTIVRPVIALQKLIDDDPFRAFDLPPKAKRVVTFLRDRPKRSLDLPIEVDDARILLMRDTEVFTAYVPSPRGAAFMNVIEDEFGKNVTTRTWESVTKVSRK